MPAEPLLSRLHDRPADIPGVVGDHTSGDLGTCEDAVMNETKELWITQLAAWLVAEEKKGKGEDESEDKLDRD